MLTPVRPRVMIACHLSLCLCALMPCHPSPRHINTLATGVSPLCLLINGLSRHQACFPSTQTRVQACHSHALPLLHLTFIIIGRPVINATPTSTSCRKRSQNGPTRSRNPRVKMKMKRKKKHKESRNRRAQGHAHCEWKRQRITGCCCEQSSEPLCKVAGYSLFSLGSK